MPQKTVGIEDLAALLGVSGWTIRTWLRQGRLPFFKIGRRVLVPVDAVDALMAENFRPAVREEVNGR
jgi:excisionase family DNA binding protein